jgi:hypothetical protein
LALKKSKNKSSESTKTNQVNQQKQIGFKEIKKQIK